MVMPVQLQYASFKGVRFLTPEDDVSGGRNNIQHLYPDKKTHYMEDNGCKPVCFQINATLAGIDVKDQFLALRAVLEAPGPGTLLHPWLGAKFVVLDEYNVSRSQGDAGVLSISLKFTETGAPAFPALSIGVGSVISGLTAASLTAMIEAFKSKYEPLNSATSVSRISQAVTSITDRVSGVFGSTLHMPEIVSALKSSAVFYNANRLGDALKTLYTAPANDDTNTDNDDLYNGWRTLTKKLISDANLVQEFDVTTIDLKKRAETLRAIRAMHFGAVLACLCESVSHRDYTTAQQATYDQRLIISTQRDVITHLEPEVRAGVIALVTETLEYLKELEIQLPKIEQLAVHEWPVGPLAYQLYGDEIDRTQVLVNINRDRNLMLFDGSTEVLRG